MWWNFAHKLRDKFSKYITFKRRPPIFQIFNQKINYDITNHKRQIIKKVVFTFFEICDIDIAENLHMNSKCKKYSKSYEKFLYKY